MLPTALVLSTTNPATDDIIISLHVTILTCSLREDLDHAKGIVRQGVSTDVNGVQLPRLQVVINDGCYIIT